MLQIKWTREAEERYLTTLKYWINHNQSNTFSLKIIDEVEKIELLLSQNPFLGSKVEGRIDEIRRVVVMEQFSIYYKVETDYILVITFWGNKDHPNKNVI